MEDVAPAGLLQIGALAERVHLSLRTARYYEQVGVFEPAGRTAAGYHLYDAKAVERLLLIKKMKPLGFSLEDVRALLTLRDELSDDRLPDDRREELRGQLRTWIVVAEENLATLREQVTAAEYLVARLRSDPAATAQTTAARPTARINP
ncbi:MerR family transcriptional regulator [Pseudofrankia sp. DC12]|uniref:MerR family transcriptional regulator n=1 Tax=Pseudofrankia sp. DC12 TaxID=683315 RepID=UPI000A069011|nr:MerR family transcriptional regulator [Pseudofrankia sp. DC12]